MGEAVMGGARMDGGRAKVFTIPAGVSFVDDLATGILDRVGPKPEDLAGVTVLLPTRRACRALRDAFLRVSGGRALLLPVMRPLGDLDAEELGLTAFAEEAPAESLDLPPALTGLRRQLLLTRLVLAFEGKAFDGRRASPEQAANLAAELARLLDAVQTERLDFGHLRALVPAELAEHWQKVLEFLTILTKAWPDVLEAEGAIDPSARRNRLLEAQADQWRAHPPQGLVVAAGSTGTVPATADLLDVVASLPKGAVVLPGLDLAMDTESWEALEPSHAQYGMARLLARLEVAREAVPVWGGAPAPALTARSRLLSEALRASATTERWAEAPAPPPEALDGLSRLTCPTPREEAAAIALLMRETLETPGKRAALVTPDRGLARRVAAELRRWDIEVDDSAGQPLDQSAPGSFLKLAAEAVAGGVAPVPLLALLKHPLAAGGEAPATFRAKVRTLDALVLRGPRPASGFAGLERALDEADQGALRPWLKGLEERARAFARLLDADAVDLREVARAHAAFAETLAETDVESGPERLWAGEAGEATAAFLAELGEAASDFPSISGAHYAAFLGALMAGRVVRPTWGRHPRLFIWGLLEARLQQADRLILGGLNEGTWPPEVRPGPWMSRPMQRKFGLPLPERRIGLTAHDFAQAACAPEVVMTRSLRVEGTPTLPSRWLMRLDNLLEGRGMAVPSAGAALDWALALDKPTEVKPVSAPRPAPPLEARPSRLSVTRIETWVRDPYALYADQVLRLRPLDPLDADPGAAERGTAVHAALEAFLKDYPGTLPGDAVDRLIDIGREVFGTTLVRPSVRAFWWPRFKRVAAWFVDYERARRAEGRATLAVEASGLLKVPVSGVTFELTAKADRIDRGPGGGLVIVDYKTGVPPSWPQVKTGLSPQLSLEGAMATAGAFPGVTADDVADLVYLRLSGGRIAGEERVLGPETAEVCEAALAGLTRRAAAFRNPQTPYLSRPRPMFAGRFNDYDHLARVAEWSAGVEEGE